jgi:hypothetical protein
MQLDTVQLARFIGGQLEIQNEKEGCVYRGEIATAIVDDDTVKVKFLWLGNLPKQ